MSSIDWRAVGAGGGAELVVCAPLLVVALVLDPPLSLAAFGLAAFGGPLVGGLVAGYLAGTDKREGARHGYLAGMAAVTMGIVLAVAGVLIMATIDAGQTNAEGILVASAVGAVALAIYFPLLAVVGYVWSALNLLTGPVGAILREQTAP